VRSKLSGLNPDALLDYALTLPATPNK
jgi:hypothetical protein